MMDTSFPPHCYYCNAKDFNNSDHYERHVVTKHPLLPGYPNIGDLERHKLKAQDMRWEKPLTDEEAMERLRRYIPVSERMKHYRRTGRPTREFWG